MKTRKKIERNRMQDENNQKQNYKNSKKIKITQN